MVSCWGYLRPRPWKRNPTYVVSSALLLSGRGDMERPRPRRHRHRGSLSWPKNRGCLWSASACRRFKSGSKLPHSKVTFSAEKIFLENKKSGDRTGNLKIVALTDEFACENFAMSLSIVEKNGGSLGRVRCPQPMLLVRFHDKKYTAQKVFPKMQKNFQPRNMRIRF